MNTLEELLSPLLATALSLTIAGAWLAIALC